MLKNHGFPSEKQKIDFKNSPILDFEILTHELFPNQSFNIYIKKIDKNFDQKSLNIIVNPDVLSQNYDSVFCTADDDVLDKIISLDSKYRKIFILVQSKSETDLKFQKILEKYLNYLKNSFVMDCGCCIAKDNNVLLTIITIKHKFERKEIEFGSALMSIIGLQNNKLVKIYFWNQYRIKSKELKSLYQLAKQFNFHNEYRKFDPKGVYSCAIINWLYANRLYEEKNLEFYDCAIVDNYLFNKYKSKLLKLIYI
jgi:hypothetical protein